MACGEDEGFGIAELVAEFPAFFERNDGVECAEDEKKFSLSLGNGPCNFAMLNRALLSRRLKHDTPHDGVQHVSPARTLFVVCPIQLKPDGRYHRTR